MSAEEPIVLKMDPDLAEEETPSERIRNALIGTDHELARLYHSSPSFFNNLNWLVNMLPSMVQGLASNAEESDRWHETARIVSQRREAEGWDFGPVV